MTLLSALAVSLTGLQTTTSQMQLVASNISNAQTEGYSKQTAVIESVQLGADAGGSRIVGYERVTDEGTYESLIDATSEDGLYSTQDRYLQNVEAIFGSNISDPALSDSISAFASAWRELSASPESTTQQKQVIQAGVNMAEELQSVSSSVEELDRNVLSDINTTVSDLNAYLEQIRDYNKKISSAYGAHQPTGQLEDSRDQIILKIAEITKVNVMSRGQGQVALYTPEGYVLIDGSPQTFSFDGTDLHSESNPGLSLNNVLTGGSLEAAVNFRADYSSSGADASTNPATEVIRKLRSQLDAIADAFLEISATDPATFAYAYNSSGNSALDFFTATGTEDHRMSLAVNEDLIDGTISLNTDSADDVVDAFNSTDRDFTADGLSLTSSSYEKLGTAVIAGFQQSANIITNKASPASTQKDYLTQRLADSTGVNVDTELVSLTTLESAYNASAKVISVINDMFDKLEAIV